MRVKIGQCLKIFKMKFHQSDLAVYGFLPVIYNPSFLPTIYTPPPFFMVNLFFKKKAAGKIKIQLGSGLAFNFRFWQLNTFSAFIDKK
jgi:hypothetical protein